jgi:hypothetical protein
VHVKQHTIGRHLRHVRWMLVTHVELSAVVGCLDHELLGHELRRTDAGSADKRQTGQDSDFWQQLAHEGHPP